MTTLRTRPRLNQSLLRAGLAALISLCLFYIGYIAFIFPPLIKSGTAGGIADGRTVCAAVGQRADERYRADFHQRNPAAEGGGSSIFDAALPSAIQAVDHAAKDAARKATADCLTETAVDTSLLVLRVVLLLLCGTGLGFVGRWQRFW